MAGKFLESKHKRGPGGQFANKIGSLASTSTTARNRLKEVQKAKLSGGKLGEGGPKQKKFRKIGLGKRVVTKLEKASKARAAKRRRGRRTRR